MISRMSLMKRAWLKFVRAWSRINIKDGRQKERDWCHKQGQIGQGTERYSM